MGGRGCSRPALVVAIEDLIPHDGLAVGAAALEMRTAVGFGEEAGIDLDIDMRRRRSWRSQETRKSVGAASSLGHLADGEMCWQGTAAFVGKLEK